MNKQYQEKNGAIDSNFSILLDIPVDGHVLIIGNGFDWVEKYFENVIKAYNITGNISFDLIFYSPTPQTTNRNIKVEVRKLQKSLSKHGFLFILVANAYSFSLVKQFVKQSTDFARDIKRTNVISFQHLIRSCDFHYTRLWILENLGNFQEIIDLKYSKVETIHNEHWLIRCLCKLGMKHYSHDSFLSICGQRPIEESKIFNKIKKIIKNSAEKDLIVPQLMRFDLRARGALIAFIKELAGGGNFIARITTRNTKTNLIIRENNAFLNWLHSDNRLPASLTKYLPCPIGKASFDSTKVYIEQMMKGVPAWKADNVQLEKKIYQQADKFITEFGMITSQPVLVNEDVFSEMFQVDVNRIGNCELIGMDFKNRLRGLLKKVKEKLLGKIVIRVISHGDYGYGNILVSQTSGELTGIIDWDTGRKREFFWIDRMNMELQLLRKIKQETLSGSLKYLWNRVVNHKDRFTVYDSYYEQRFKVSSQMLQLLIIITLIRFISRSVQYPHLFRHVIIEYENSLKFLTKNL